MQITDQTGDNRADTMSEYATAKPKLRVPPIKRQKTLPKPPPLLGEAPVRVYPKPKLRTPPIKRRKTPPSPPPRLGDRE